MVALARIPEPWLSLGPLSVGSRLAACRSRASPSAYNPREAAGSRTLSGGIYPVSRSFRFSCTGLFEQRRIATGNQGNIGAHHRQIDDGKPEVTQQSVLVRTNPAGKELGSHVQYDQSGYDIAQNDRQLLERLNLCPGRGDRPAGATLRSRQLIMRPVTARRIPGLLAAAERHRAGLLGIELHRGERTALVRAVTEWLLAAFAAGAPPIRFPGLDIDFEREPDYGRDVEL